MMYLETHAGSLSALLARILTFSNLRRTPVLNSLSLGGVLGGMLGAANFVAGWGKC